MRTGLYGTLDAGWRIFALLIVTRFFDGSSFSKAMVPAAYMIGLLSTPIALFYLSRLKMRSAQICSVNYAIAGALFLVSSFASDSLWLFLGSGVLAAALLAQQMPLIVHIYSTNYTAADRGKRVAHAITLGVAIAPLFGWFGGIFLEEDLSRFPVIFQIMAGACAISALCMAQMPSETLQRSPSANPLAHLSLVWKDKVFGSILAMWMILGFGNLATMPLQIEYLSSSEYGIQATSTQIAIATIVIPSVVRILTTSIWGHLFDSFNFLLVRGLSSAFLFAAILVFFFSDTITGIYIGSAGYGLALAGANVNWSLWVTKFAPEGEESNYMTVHSFLTGLRGLCAPFIGFYMIGFFSIREWSVIGACLVGLSILLLYPIDRLSRR